MIRISFQVHIDLVFMIVRNHTMMMITLRYMMTQQRLIDLGHSSLPEIRMQLLQGLFGQGEDEYTTRIHIQPMDDHLIHVSMMMMMLMVAVVVIRRGGGSGGME